MSRWREPTGASWSSSSSSSSSLSSRCRCVLMGASSYSRFNLVLYAHILLVHCTAPTVLEWMLHRGSLLPDEPEHRVQLHFEVLTYAIDFHRSIFGHSPGRWLHCGLSSGIESGKSLARWESRRRNETCDDPEDRRCSVSDN